MINHLSNPWWLFVLLGVGAGIISGTLGLGSGVILVPMLALLCGFEQKSAQGMALAIMVPIALVGALRYWKNPDIEMYPMVIGLIICGALAGTLAGTELAARLPSNTLRKIFAMVLIVIAMRMLLPSSRSKKPVIDESLLEQKTVNLIEPGATNNETEQ